MSWTRVNKQKVFFVQQVFKTNFLNALCRSIKNVKFS